MFTALENQLEGKTTSRVERLFRTVNMRINVSKWSPEGALNITKVRLAYYYKGFDACQLYSGSKMESMIPGLLLTTLAKYLQFSGTTILCGRPVGLVPISDQPQRSDKIRCC
jgi:hypothetical protein